MNFTHLFLTGLVLVSCSGSKVDVSNKSELKIKLDNLPSVLIWNIAKFLKPNGIAIMRNLNHSTRSSFPLSILVNMIFNISGLEINADNEPELDNIMKLAWISHDHFLCFAALMEEVVVRKKTYNFIFRPLILNLLKIFRALDYQKKKTYEQYFYERFQNPVEVYLASLCAEKGHFDLFFQIANNDANVLEDFFINFQNSKEVLELFRANPDYAEKCLHILLDRGNKYMLAWWIAKFIINDLPQSYYEGFFGRDTKVLEFMTSFLFFSVDVPESNYERIYNQVRKILYTYSGEISNAPNLAVLGMINDIRFGLFDLDDLQAAFANFDFFNDKSQICQIAKAALLADKKDLFFDVYQKYKSMLGFMDQIVNFFDLNLESLQVKSFKIIFDMIQTASNQNFEMIHFDSAAFHEMLKIDPDYIFNTNLADPKNIFETYDSLYSFVTKFYAVKNLKMEGNLVTLRFVLAENLLHFGFPAVLEFVQPIDYHLYHFIGTLLRLIKVFDENAMISFILDLIEFYKNISESKNYFYSSFDLAEFISISPNLLQLIQDEGIIFYLDGNLERYFDLPNQGIFHLSESYWELSKLKTKDQIEKMEFIKDNSVIEIFRQRENYLIRSIWNNRENIKLMYFEWRTIFEYWLKYHAGHGMRQIRIPEFLELLRLEFPMKLAITIVKNNKYNH